MFEGWVSITDKSNSQVFESLISKSKEILSLLPWSPNIEKTKVLHPEFAMLKIISFACMKFPRGINIPNYYEIKQNLGFKNVMFESVNGKL